MKTLTRTENTKIAPHPDKTDKALARKSWGRACGETLIATAVAICILESFFNFAGVGQQEFFEPDQQLGARHIPSKQVTWRMEGLSRDSFNSFGMRDYERTLAKKPGTTRIAILGDSAAEGLQVPLQDTFPVVIQDMLNKEANQKNAKQSQNKSYEVLNFGCAGYSSAQEIVQYETQVAKFSPDIVVLFYNQNDALESVIDNSMRAITDPKPYCYMSPEGELKFDNAILEARADELKPNPVLAWLRKDCRIYGVINQTLFSLSVNDKRFVKLKQWLTRQKQSRNIAPASYPKQDPDQVGAKLIERLNADVKATGGQLIVMMFPNTADYPDLKRQQDLFSKLAQTAGFRYLDLTPHFKNYKNKHELIIEYHFSKKGHKFLAELLKPYIH
jgi:lysophospholipase L1-like esterase